MDSGAAGHVMPDTMFPHVKLERKTSPEKFVAANGEQIKDLGEKNNSIQDKRGNPEVQNIQKCECCQTTHFNAKGRPSWKHCCAGRKESAHSKRARRNSDQAGREQFILLFHSIPLFHTLSSHLCTMLPALQACRMRLDHSLSLPSENGTCFIEAKSHVHCVHTIERS